MLGGAVLESFVGSDGDVRELIVAVVTSDAFRNRTVTESAEGCE